MCKITVFTETDTVDMTWPKYQEIDCPRCHYKTIIHGGSDFDWKQAYIDREASIQEYTLRLSQEITALKEENKKLKDVIYCLR